MTLMNRENSYALDIHALAELPSLPVAQRKQLPKCAAVYFVVDDDVVLYVGQTIQLRARWKSHQKLQVALHHEHARIVWMQLEHAADRDWYEAEAIERFSPRYNECVTVFVHTHKDVTLFMPIHMYDALVCLANNASITVAQQCLSLIEHGLVSSDDTPHPTPVVGLEV